MQHSAEGGGRVRNLQGITMVASEVSNELPGTSETVHEQLECEFMAEMQKPEQLEFAFVHTEEGMDK